MHRKRTLSDQATMETQHRQQPLQQQQQQGELTMAHAPQRSRASASHRPWLNFLLMCALLSATTIIPNALARRSPYRVRRRLKSSDSDSSSSDEGKGKGKGQVHVFFPDPNAMVFDDANRGKGKGKGSSSKSSKSEGKGGKGKGGGRTPTTAPSINDDGTTDQPTGLPTCTPTNSPTQEPTDNPAAPSTGKGGKGKGGKGMGKGGNRVKSSKSSSSSSDGKGKGKGKGGKGKGKGKGDLPAGGRKSTKSSKGMNSSDDDCAEIQEPTTPSEVPTNSPTITMDPDASVAPTPSTNVDTDGPTLSPTTAMTPTNAPTGDTGMPTIMPTNAPTFAPTEEVIVPSTAPTNVPTPAITDSPSNLPSRMGDTMPPTETTLAPTLGPTRNPTLAPTSAPTRNPTLAPTLAPTRNPTIAPTAAPTPTISEVPSFLPTASCNGPSLLVEEFFLVNADTNMRIRPLTNGETFSLATEAASAGTSNFAVEAATSPERVGSVRFETSLDGGTANVTVSNTFPYAVAGVDAVGSGLYRIDNNAMQYRNGETLQEAFQNLGCEGGDPNSPVCLENSGPINVALVVDLSFSTLGGLPLTSVGDLNNDGISNSILDAQIAALVSFVEEIAATPGLDNSNVNIGLIPFDTEAIYLGSFDPLDASGTMPHPDLLAQFFAFRTAADSDELNGMTIGYTNFDDGLDKAIEYFENDAPPNRENVMVFMSDGVPNVRGDDDDEIYCAETTNQGLPCDETPDGICFRGDTECGDNPYATCVRGSNLCARDAAEDAVTNFDSEILDLDRERVRRIAIGVGRNGDVSGGIGDIAGDFGTFEFRSGTWSITATPFCEVEEMGESGMTAMISFTVTE